MNRRQSRALVALAGLAVFAPSAWASSRSWTFNGDGNWSETAKWSPNGLPNVSDIAFIGHNDAISRNVTLNVTSTPLDLDIGNVGSGIDTLIQSGAFNLTMGAEAV